MRRSIFSFIAALTAFGLGCLVATNLIWKTGENIAPPIAVERDQPVASTDKLAQADSNDGMETWDNVGCLGDSESEPRFGPIRLPANRILTTICGSLYVRDRKGSTVWANMNGAPLVDAPKIIGGELVVIGSDLHLYALDPATGVQKWQYNANGRASYVQLEGFTKDRFFVLVDMSGYDDQFQLCLDRKPAGSSDCPRGFDDKLWIFRKDKLLHEWSVPARSKVEVIGDEAFVAWNAKGKRTRRQILVHD